MGRFPNIAAAKAKTGAAKGKLYGMYAKEIYLAAKNGGVTPEGNPSLKRLIEKAKKEQVPSDVIKRAIDKVNSGAGENYETLTYELFGPAGSTLMVECLTDNVNRSVSDVRAAVNKAHVKMGAQGSVAYMYDNLCIVGFNGISEEDIMNGVTPVTPVVPVTNSDIIGLDINYLTNTYTRTYEAANKQMGSSFNVYTMYGGRMRCNVSDSGEITAFYGDSNYRDDGSNGQVMIY